MAALNQPDRTAPKKPRKGKFIPNVGKKPQRKSKEELDAIVKSWDTKPVDPSVYYNRKKNLTKEQIENIVKEEIEKALGGQEGQPSKEDIAMAARGYLSDYYERKGQVDFNSMERYTKLQKELEEYGQSGSLSPSASKNAKSIIEAVLKLSKEAPDYFKRYVEIGKDVNIQSYGL